jgi:ADP-L-glycero-D-manno-heptose 6-epimerase
MSVISQSSGMKSNRPIMITGAAGFIGARFVGSCRELEIPVISVDALSYFRSRNEHTGIPFGRVVDKHEVFDWLESELPSLSAIVHLGACTDTTEMDTVYLKENNLEYSKRLWTYAVEEQIPFIYASSAATYGNGSQGYNDEESLIPALRPLNPYGQSKQDFDLWVLEQERLRNSPSVWSGFKFFNVYGFGERHKRNMASVVLHAFDQIQLSGKVKLFRSYRPDIEHGHQKRDFVYVEDVTDALHFALQKPLRRGIFNLGSGTARTFMDLARCVFRELDKPERIEFIDMPEEIRERYQYHTEARMDRLRQEGYLTPFSSLEQGIRLYVQHLLKGAYQSQSVPTDRTPQRESRR